MMAKPETSEQQQSIFYVVWPEDRSPAAAATAGPTATNLISMNPAGTQAIGSAAGSLTPIESLLPSSSTTAPIYTGLGSSSPAAVVPGAGSLGGLPLVGATAAAGHSPTTASRSAAPQASGTEESDSSEAGSPASTGQSAIATTTSVAEVTITDTGSVGEFSGNLTPIATTTTHNVLISPAGPRSHAFGLTANGGSGSLSTVYNQVSSPGVIYVSDASSVLTRSHPLGPLPPPLPPQLPVHRGSSGSIITGAGPAQTMLLQQFQENPRKQKHPPPHTAAEPPPLKCIGTWAELALGNLQKILKVVSSHEAETLEETGSPRKRVCVRDAPPSSHTDCLECEVKNAEINVLRKRVIALQDQMSAMASATSVIQHHRVTNGNTKSPLSPPSLSPTPQQQMETAMQLQVESAIHSAVPKEFLHIRRRSRPSIEHATVTDTFATAVPPEPQPGEAIELVSGSGVYILAYRLEEARREAKTGTQLARKLMDCFWDKDTLAKSTLTPRSKFQYQQLDPKIIKAIEVYCLSYDSTVHAKDIHATMTDKCCQARSRYRIQQ